MDEIRSAEDGSCDCERPHPGDVSDCAECQIRDLLQEVNALTAELEERTRERDEAWRKGAEAMREKGAKWLREFGSERLAYGMAEFPLPTPEPGDPK